MLPVSVRYEGDGQNVIWPIPFLFSDPSSVRVRRVSPEGVETELVAGSDYGILDNRVVCPLARGSGLVVYLGEAPAAQGYASLQQARAVAQPLQAATYSARDAPVYQGDAPDVSPYVEAVQAASRACVEEGQSRLDARASQLEESVSGALGRAAEAERRRIERELRLCGSPLPQEAVIRGRTLAPGELIDLGVAYVAGSHTLSLYRNGLLLAQGLDYEECGQAGESATRVKLIQGSAADDVWQARVASIGSSENAARASQQAMDWQNRTARLAAQTEQNAREARSARDGADRARQVSDAGLAAVQKSADLAYFGACRAWEAATQASIHATRPGISAVRDVKDIHHCSPGLFIVNPHLTHAPTLFMGVWPAACVDEMKWDGVFFIGPKYPANPVLPPAMPEKPPFAGPATGDGDDWLPCGHNHQCGSCPSPCAHKKPGPCPK